MPITGEVQGKVRDGLTIFYDVHQLLSQKLLSVELMQVRNTEADQKKRGD